MEFADTHCHLQFPGLEDTKSVLAASVEAEVTKLICVGTTLNDSAQAVEIAKNQNNVWASVGVHPHDAKNFAVDKELTVTLQSLLDQPKVVAVGEIGLDYFKNYSAAEDQKRLFVAQIEAAIPSKKPFIFHVREAWEDFWSIINRYPGISGVVHSFSATPKELQAVLDRGFFVGLNGIMTFTKDEQQLAAAKEVPLQNLLLETDAPFLTPRPFRGTMCEPKHTRVTAEFLADLRGESLEQLAAATTANAARLFNFA